MRFLHGTFAIVCLHLTSALFSLHNIPLEIKLLIFQSSIDRYNPQIGLETIGAFSCVNHEYYSFLKSHETIQSLIHAAHLLKKGNGYALREATMKGKTQVVKRLLTLGVDIHQKSKWNTTALHLAVRLNKKDIVKLLLQHGAAKHINEPYQIVGSQPRTQCVLLEAIANKDINTLTMLLSYGANIHFVSPKHETLLHYAVYKGSATIVSFLINRGLNTHAKTIEGNTPLHEVNTYNVTRALLDAGAPVHTKNNQRLSPLERVQKKYQECVASIHHTPCIRYCGDRFYQHKTQLKEAIEEYRKIIMLLQSL